MTLTNWTILCLIISLTINICCIWYIRRLLNKVLFISQNLTDLVDLINTYRNHLKSVYDLELYYGDETIKFLTKHTNSLLDMLIDYDDIYKMTEPIEISETDEENDYDEETRPEGERKKDVFYGGSRSRNS
jgi:hypothetical protein